MKPATSICKNLLILSLSILLTACPQQKYRAESAENSKQRITTTENTVIWANKGSVEPLNPLAYPSDALYKPTNAITPTLVGNYVVVPAGRFKMGSYDGVKDETPVHTVFIKGFKLGETEITQKQWRTVMGSNPSSFDGCDNCPVENVSWDDVQIFIVKLNQSTNKNFRLPSEAEWEYACRSGGKSQKYCGGNSVDSFAWYESNSGSETNPVKEKRSNGLGLYDMGGNVWEWTQDCWNNNYSGAPSDGSAWTSGNCEKRVLRGGAWFFSAEIVSSVFRSRSSVTTQSDVMGFRLALDI